MLALGIILVLVAAAVILAAVFGGATEPVVFELGAFEVRTNTFTVFITGALTVLVLVGGLALIRSGVRRAGRRRQEKKELNRLASKLEQRESVDRGPTGSATTSTGPTAASTGSSTADTSSTPPATGAPADTAPQSGTTETGTGTGTGTGTR